MKKLTSEPFSANFVFLSFKVYISVSKYFTFASDSFAMASESFIWQDNFSFSTRPLVSSSRRLVSSSRRLLISSSFSFWTSRYLSNSCPLSSSQWPWLSRFSKQFARLIIYPYRRKQEGCGCSKYSTCCVIM